MRKRTIFRINAVIEHMIGAKTQIVAIEYEEEADEFVREIASQAKREISRVVDKMNTLISERG